MQKKLHEFNRPRLDQQIYKLIDLITQTVWRWFRNPDNYLYNIFLCFSCLFFGLLHVNKHLCCCQKYNEHIMNVTIQQKAREELNLNETGLDGRC